MVQAAKNIDLPVSKPAQVLRLLLIRVQMYSFIALVLCTCILFYGLIKSELRIPKLFIKFIFLFNVGFQS